MKEKMCDYEYVIVNEKQFDNFCRFFKDKIEVNFFMDWENFYDWSFSNKYKKGSYEHLHECMIARHYCAPKPYEKFYICKDYIEKNNYNLKTIVPEPKKQKLTKKREKMIADMLCEEFDNALMELSKRWYIK